jgi:hypothetical protein
MKVNQHFRGTYHLHFQGQRVSQVRNQHEEAARGSAYCLLHAGILLDLHFNLENGCDIPPKLGSTFRLQSIIYSNTEFFIVTVMRTSNPINLIL